MERIKQLIFDSQAVKDLGSRRFEFTEIFLRDDGLIKSFENQEPLIKLKDGGQDSKKGEPAEGISSSPIDLELAMEMNDLGLPLSFRSKTEKRTGMTNGRRRGTKKNSEQSLIGKNDSFLESIKVSQGSISPVNLLDTSKFQDQSEILNHGIIADVNSFSISLERGDSASSVTSPYEDDTVTNSLCIEDGSCLINVGPGCDGKDLNGEVESALMQTPMRIDLEISGDSSNWIQSWDDFYARTFFYNEKTGESTWDLPPGMESLPFASSADEPTKIVVECNEMNDEEMLALNNPLTDLYLAEESIGGNVPIGQELDEIADDTSVYAVKKKKKAKRTRPNMKMSISSEDFQGSLQEFTPIISKYWGQRYILFSKFDCGIQMDEEGWFSVTPEVLAKHHAKRCGKGSIVDFFTGVGGNSIQFAKRSKHVIAIDIDPNKIEFARHNAAIYGVEDKINFIVGDSFCLAPTLKADTVFMSPPWGGPDYSKVKTFDINSMLKPRDGKFLFDVGRKIAPTIVMFLPRNIDPDQLAKLCLSASPSCSLEIEVNYLNGRVKAVTAYFRSSEIIK